MHAKEVLEVIWFPRQLTKQLKLAMSQSLLKLFTRESQGQGLKILAIHPRIFCVLFMHHTNFSCISFSSISFLHCNISRHLILQAMINVLLEVQVSLRMTMNLLRQLTNLEGINLGWLDPINDPELTEISTSLPNLQHLKVSANFTD